MPVLSLGTRLALIVILGSFVTVAAIMTVAYKALVDDFETLLTEQQLSETRSIASEVEQRLNLKLDLISDSARKMADGQQLRSPAEIQFQLNQENLLHSLFPDGILVFDAEATAIEESLHVPGRLGTNYSDREHFQLAARTRLPTISRPIMGRTTGVPLIAFLSPIESDENDLLGFLAGTINLGKTSLIPEDILQRLRSDNDIFKVIDVEHHLYIEGGPNASKRVQPLPPPGTDPLVDAALSGVPFGTVTSASGQDLIYAGSHLEKLGWMFIRALPYERATAPATESFISFSGISVAIGLLIALLSFIASRSTTRPLNSITRAIEQMSKTPSMGQRLTATGSLETRKLATAFNQLMSERDTISTLKENFVSNISHELRTPLTSMNGALRLLASGTAGGLTGNAEKMAKLALRNGDRLQLLICDLLDFSKLSAGQMTVSLSEQPLDPIISAAIMSNEALACEHHVTFATEGAFNQVVLADSLRLRQVLDNFISNAIKFSPEHGTITVTTETVNPGYLRIVVRDRGDGVPAAFEPRLFERFSQADSSSSKSVSGTGLGLAICRELATLMNGNVGYYFDRGANFWIELADGNTRESKDDDLS